MLVGNKLCVLLESMWELKNLELFRLADNRFETFSSWILESFWLSWFVVVVNFVMDMIGDKVKICVNFVDVVMVDWFEFGVVEDVESFGKGASGVVYAGRWNGEIVVVKVYNNVVKISDGCLEDEMMVLVFVVMIKSEGMIKIIVRF